MKFLVDECTGPAVARWLSQQGYDTYSVYDQSRGINDKQVIRLAINEKRILITNDKDFGEKIYRDQCPHVGIILLRLQDERSESKVNVISHLLAQYKDKLPGAFTVVSEQRVKFAQTR